MEATVNMNALFPRKVILNDGTEFSGSASLNSDGDVLNVNIDKGPELTEVFAAFNNPDKTSRIRSIVESKISTSGGSEQEFTGFTRFMDIGVVGDRYRILLKKPLSE